MDTKTEIISEASVANKHSPTLQSLEDPEAHSEISVDYAGSSRKTDPAEIALVRKLDMCMMVSFQLTGHSSFRGTHLLRSCNINALQQPFLWILCFMNIFSRQAISVARLDSLEEDLGINDTQFSTAVSVHYASYILGQIPSNLLLTRVRPSWYICGTMAVTSITSMLHVFVVNNTGLILQRFFLGIIAAPYYPGAMYMISLCTSTLLARVLI